MPPLRTLLGCSLLTSLLLHAEQSPADTEQWSPLPPVVQTQGSHAPSDAFILFDGGSLDAWCNEAGGAAGWLLEDGVLTVKPGAGSLVTRRAFADCQLHLEWRSPSKIEGEGQNRGNSGVYLQKRYEVQVLDSHDNPTYVNGQAASLYKKAAPLVNASRAPGEWQSYDIIFRAPRFNGDGSLRRPAVVTVFHNGILVQDHVTLSGPTAWIGNPPYEAHPFKQPLSLQDHGCAVSYRNIWLRELDTPQTQDLLAGSDFGHWNSFLEKQGTDRDPNGNFTLDKGVLHIIGKDFGYLSTKNEYANYHLRAQFRWGQRQWAPRETGKKDSGILYHFPSDQPHKVWPRSVEFQVQEEDCGDFWFVDTDGQSPNQAEHAWGMKHVIRTANHEMPAGEWNTLEIVCANDHVEHYVNGILVNVADKLSVSKGRILLQSEGAELWYKNLRLTPLD